jgi:hypothetical protein
MTERSGRAVAIRLPASLILGIDILLLGGQANTNGIRGRLLANLGGGLIRRVGGHIPWQFAFC